MEKTLEKWTLIIIQGTTNKTEMCFRDFNELASYMTRYRDNYSDDTRFVLHNDGWEDIDIYMTAKSAGTTEEVPLPDGF